MRGRLLMMMRSALNSFLLIQSILGPSVWVVPLGCCSCPSSDSPSTCRSAASGCRCERWSLCVWQRQPTSDKWSYSSSLVRTSAVSWPPARHVCMTDPEARRPADQTPCTENTVSLQTQQRPPQADRETSLLTIEHHRCSSWLLFSSFHDFIHVS